MKPLISFVDIEDPWEIEYLKKSLSNTALIKNFRETADPVIDKINDTTILSTFINSSVDKKTIDSFIALETSLFFEYNNTRPKQIKDLKGG